MTAQPWAPGDGDPADKRHAPATLRNRDAIDGRPRGHLRQFGLSRIRLRELAHRGVLPGVTKSSW